MKCSLECVASSLIEAAGIRDASWNKEISKNKKVYTALNTNHELDNIVGNSMSNSTHPVNDLNYL